MNWRRGRAWWLLATAWLPAQEPAFAHLTAPPRGLPAMALPAAPAPTQAMFDLGKALFHDPILSLDKTVSCHTCHRQDHAFASPERLPRGVGGQQARRHAPSLLNRGYGKTQRWDGSSPTLEAFVLEPIADPREMALPVEQALQRLRAEERHATAFSKAFPDGVNQDNLATALATFVRGIVAGDAPYDEFLAGRHDALTPAQRAGLWVFESKGACWKCHTPPLFTDEDFHATGIGVVDGTAEPGRAAHTGKPADHGRFKTPGLRGLRHSAPYMHDGSLATLADVVAFYVRGGNPHPQLDRKLAPLTLTEADRLNLVAFLESL